MIKVILEYDRTGTDMQTTTAKLQLQGHLQWNDDDDDDDAYKLQ
jgi:hypothetical protein